MQDKRKRYKCECKCGNVFYATKSILQNMGMLNAGCGSCPKCKTFYNLTLDEENEIMELLEWDEYQKNIVDSWEPVDYKGVKKMNNELPMKSTAFNHAYNGLDNRNNTLCVALGTYRVNYRRY